MSYVGKLVQQHHAGDRTFSPIHGIVLPNNKIYWYELKRVASCWFPDAIRKELKILT